MCVYWLSFIYFQLVDNSLYAFFFKEREKKLLALVPSSLKFQCYEIKLEEVN